MKEFLVGFGRGLQRAVFCIVYLLMLAFAKWMEVI